MLELAILGLLEEQDLHGYELRKRLRARLGVFANLSFGSLYPALARLEASGAVVSMPLRHEPADPDEAGGTLIPLTGSLGGERAALGSDSRRLVAPKARRVRSRKIYHLTPDGDTLFHRLLDDEMGADRARAFPLRLAFAGHLAPQARIALLERRRAELMRSLDKDDTGAGSDLDRYGRALLEHRRESLVFEIEWLERLINAERAYTRTTASQPGEQAQATTRRAASHHALPSGIRGSTEAAASPESVNTR